MNRVFLSVALLVLIQFPAAAELVVPPVVSSAARTEQARVDYPVQISVINQDEIVASGATTVTDVLRGRAGMQVSDLRGDGADATLSVRGFAQTVNSNVLVLVDGRRLNHSDTRSPDISHIALNDVERIEVIQGSAGVLYGNQAVGGVINIITRKPTGKVMDIRADIGSYGRRSLRLNAGDRRDNGFSWLFSAEMTSSDGYRDHSERDFSNLSGYMSYQYDAGNIFVDLQQVRDELELPGALVQADYIADRRQSNAGFANDFSESLVNVFRFGIRQKLNSRWHFEGEFTHRETDEDVTQSFQNNPSPPGGHTRRDQTSLNPRLIGDVRMGDMDMLITLGMDVEQTDFDLYLPYNGFFGPDVVDRFNDQHTRAAYAQAVISLNDSLSMTVGGRYAAVDNRMIDSGGYGAFPAGIDVDDNVFARTLGLNFRLDEHWRFYARLDENFRFAKVDEMTLAIPGTILNTQTGLSTDAGMAWSNGDSYVDLSVYRLKLKDEIYYDPTAGLWGANTNLDETMRYGLVVSAGFAVNNQLSLSGDFTYTHARFESGGLKGNDVSGVSPYIASLRLDYRPDSHWDARAELQLVSSKYAQGDNLNVREKAPGYGLLNLVAGYQAGQWEYRLKINNVLDKQYSEFIADGFTRSYQPSPGRNVLFTVGYNFD